MENQKTRKARYTLVETNTKTLVRTRKKAVTSCVMSESNMRHAANGMAFKRSQKIPNHHSIAVRLNFMTTIPYFLYF